MVTHADIVGGIEPLVARLRDANGSGRRLVGIAGPPGSGKTYIASWLVRSLMTATPAIAAVSVPMDGFHLANEVLADLGLSTVKGRPDTFDVGGFISLLHRLRAETDRIVYAPAFDRDRETAIAGAIPVAPGTSVVLVEGNYLLHDDGRWAEIADLLDEVWYLDVDPAVRASRLLSRHHQGHGAAAAEWFERVDQPNALLVEASRPRADLLISA